MKADKAKIERLLKTAKGQIDGILKMIENDSYCIDISNQILASIAILKKANVEILDAHLHHCIKENNAEEKLDEISDILKKLGK